jgi:hypothetical protein
VELLIEKKLETTSRGWRCFGERAGLDSQGAAKTAWGYFEVESF